MYVPLSRSANCWVLPLPAHWKPISDPSGANTCKYRTQHPGPEVLVMRTT